MDNLNEENKNETTSLDELGGIKKYTKYKILLYIIFFVVIILLFLYLFRAPIQKGDTLVHIRTSDSLLKVSNELKDKNVIHSTFLFKTLVSVLGGDKNIKSGDYLFKKGESLSNVSWQIIRGIHGVAPIKITFREGITNEEIIKLLTDKISGFDKNLFLNDPRTKQGYLFPDTYFFFPLTTTDEILNEMSINFNKKIASKENEIKSSGKSLKDIIIMASILEKEASGKEDTFVISGILWKRIKLGMPLQVDAAPNTYKTVGLPESPISNPGLLSIDSAIHPKDSPYLFYLHDKEGLVHYAINFNEHKINIAKYLK
jgi:UPF0755 protein